ncbi:MAG: hypothetical protein FJ109_02445 [Deltaproteobacteria bacterium]|nr:hypothetical protein [Deltaproteobacteria bacterium]
MRTFVCLAVCLLIVACAEQHDRPLSGDQEIRITFLHTSDIHSRLLPYRMQVTYTDAMLGLNQDNEPFGGIARIGHIINRERKRAGRVLYLDSGDVFQGAPIFNAFLGEAEFLALTYLNPDAVVVGNHEFDMGLKNLIEQTRKWVTFPFLAANYFFMPDNELGDLTQPYTIINADGIKIGVIGLGDFGSLASITDIGNSLKLMPLNNIQVINDYIGQLRPYVDLVVLLSHAGLSDDQEIAAGTRGVDIIFGGHLHIVLNPPKVVKDLDGNEVLLVHSGAFAKFVGRLDIVTRREASGRLRVVTHDYQLFPVDSTVPEDPKLAQLMEKYRLDLNQKIDLTSVYSYSPKLLTKYGLDGGDSSLGNLVSEAIRKYARVGIAFTNTLGIRANMYPGPITLDDLFNIFPFENTITLMYMSGTDIRDLMDYNTQRSSGRGCVSQLQIAGLRHVMNCNPDPPVAYFDCHTCEPGEKCLVNCIAVCKASAACESQCVTQYRKCVLDKTGKYEDVRCLDSCLPEGVHRYTADVDKEVRWCLHDCFPRAEDIMITDCPDPLAVEDPTTCKVVPLVANQVYEVATNDYIAKGGSGFTILKSNNTQTDTGLPLREAVQETLLTSGKCLDFCIDRDGDVNLQGCSVYQGCLESVGAFLGQFCDKVDKTGGADVEVPLLGCAVDSGACVKDGDCYHPELDCVGVACPTCKTAAQCMVNDPDSLCVDGFCLPRTHACALGRCVRLCAADTDCPGDDSEQESLCVNGRCEPPPSVSCLTSTECVDPFAVCFAGAAVCAGDGDCPTGESCRRKRCIPDRPECDSPKDCPIGAVCAFGRCSPPVPVCKKSSDCDKGGKCADGLCSYPCGNCRDADDCPANLACVKDYCVHINADCHEHRCRNFCDAQADCKSGELCTEGVCMPRVCTWTPKGETACRINSDYKTQEKCLNVACADSRVDGRIGRILPENLGDLEFGFVPENPEDIDHE